jgi:DNA topoisomerase-1
LNTLDSVRRTAAEDAKDANLRYVSDEAPGIRRLAKGNAFRYRWPDGKPVRDRATIERIAKLAIPPAYTDVWICTVPNGHVQATGRDARGRKQYRYHKRWRETRDASKFAHLLEFARALPAIRETVARDLSRRGMPKEKVLAAVVTLLEATLIRVGNEEYARANDSYGLTTLTNGHVRVRGAELRFQFKGKSGVLHRVDLQDRRIARIVAQCLDLPGQHLFSYVDESGVVSPIDSADVNDYIRTISNADYSAKDFRTWLATTACAQWLAENPAETATDRKRMLAEACRVVAKLLRNTPAVCRSSYIHPAIFERYISDGSFVLPHRPSGRPQDEAAVLDALLALTSTGRTLAS